MIAFGTPESRVSIVSTSRMHSSGAACAIARKAPSSPSPIARYAWTREWAWVPAGWRPSAMAASTFDVVAHPPISAARIPSSTPVAGPRRIPNSSTRPPRALRTTRAAFVAMRVG